MTGVAEAIPAPDLPLAGIRILELSTVVTAALAATLMSEQGATTIKVEPVGIGDTLRHLGTAREGVSAMFANCNRGKRSVALDLKRPEGLAIARELARDADVLISNYRPGVLERLGLGAGTLRRDNPGLIHLSISGFGTAGPVAAARGSCVRVLLGPGRSNPPRRGLRRERRRPIRMRLAVSGS